MFAVGNMQNRVYSCIVLVIVLFSIKTTVNLPLLPPPHISSIPHLLQNVTSSAPSWDGIYISSPWIWERACASTNEWAQHKRQYATSRLGPINLTQFLPGSLRRLTLGIQSPYCERAQATSRRHAPVVFQPRAPASLLPPHTWISWSPALRLPTSQPRPRHVVE